MKKLFKSSLAFMMGLMAAFTATAQEQGMPQMPPLPIDPAVRTGVLPNGLTYYIRHNETPKGQADFYIAQKVGSILEEDNQRGLAHFLEHMCFNGTENFPGKNIINWLEANGVKFGQNLNAYTSVDETVYNISAVPVARQSVQDSCLLILHDWSCALTLDPKEIDAERGVIHEEWRRSMQGSMRIFENTLPKIFPGNKYGERLPIGIMEVVDNFPPQAIIDYYHTWYRPDQQGIIVVGDIDPDYIEGKIKEIFSPIPMPENARERVYLPVEDTPGTIYAVGADPEMSASVALVEFKFDNMLPREMRNTQAFYPVQFMCDVVETMLNARLSDLANKPDCPYAQASVSIGDFIIAKTKQSLELQVVGKGDDIRPAIEAAYREVLRAARGGFTQGEYERTTAELRSRYQKMYDSRNNTPTERFSREYVKAFIDNYPIPGIEAEKQIMDAISQMIPVEAVNQLLPQIITDDNRAVIVMLPTAESIVVPTEETLATVFAGVEAEQLEPYKDEMKAEPLIPALPTPGSIVSETHNELWDATEYTLSNGIKVIVKPTNFKDNEIRFEALATGGFSVFPESYTNTVLFLPYAMSNYALGDYTNSDLKKYLQGKQASLNMGIQATSRELSGNTTVQDLPTLMELIYAYFTEYTFNADEFAATQNMFKGALANQESTPDFAFSKLARKSIYASPMMGMVTTAAIDAASREQAIEIVRTMLEDPTSYTFAFVGNIDLATFKPLMEQYMATLPVSGKKVEFTQNPAFEPATGSANTTETMEMATPQTWALYFIDAAMPYTPANKVMASMVGQVMSKRLLDKIREEMGATYSIGAGSSMSRLSTVNTMLQIPFPMKPEMQDEVCKEVEAIINDLATNITEAELAPVREFMVKEATEQLDENSDWADAIVATSINNVPTFLAAPETISAITAEDLMNFWKSVLDQKNIHRVLLEPTNK